MRLVDEAKQNHRVRQPFQGLVVNSSVHISFVAGFDTRSKANLNKSKKTEKSGEPIELGSPDGRVGVDEAVTGIFVPAGRSQIRGCFLKAILDLGRVPFPILVCIIGCGNCSRQYQGYCPGDMRAGYARTTQCCITSIVVSGIDTNSGSHDVELRAVGGP